MRPSQPLTVAWTSSLSLGVQRALVLKRWGTRSMIEIGNEVHEVRSDTLHAARHVAFIDNRRRAALRYWQRALTLERKVAG